VVLNWINPLVTNELFSITFTFRPDASLDRFKRQDFLRTMSEVVVRTRILGLKEKEGLTFADANAPTVEIVTSALVAAFKEYQFTARSTLVLVVEKVLKKLLEEASVSKPTQSAVASLNQMMSNSYSRGASKRSRPDDDAPVVTEEESNKEDNKEENKDNKTSGDEKFTGEPGAVPIKAATEKSSTSAKKKKVVSSRSSEVSDSINPLLVRSFIYVMCIWLCREGGNRAQ